MPSRVVNERHAQAMDAGNATGRMIGRIAAIIMATLVTLATVFAFGSTTSAAFAASSSYADYATWSAVAEDINKQLAQGESDYRSGNTYQAATDFQNARWMNYDASNFSTVVNNTIGEDKQKALLQEFTDLETLAYQQNNADTIAGKVDALSNDIAATAQTLDANSSLANPRDYAKQRDAQTTKERQQLDAVKKNSSKGKGDRTWSDVAKEMNVILDKAYKAAISGKGDEGSSLVNNAYYQYYEKLGFEKNVMNAISGDRVSQVEYQFKMTRKTMRDGGSQKGIKTLVDDLKSWLIEDAATLDGGAADGVNGFAKFITSSIGQAFLVLIREGLEALPCEIWQQALHQVDLSRRARRSRRLRPDRRALHLPFRWFRTNPGNLRRRVCAHRHAYAAMDQQLDAQQELRGSMEPLHPRQNRNRGRQRGQQSRRGRTCRIRHGRLARHAQLPRRLP